jgi:hypothetical protein
MDPVLSTRVSGLGANVVVNQVERREGFHSRLSILS